MAWPRSSEVMQNTRRTGHLKCVHTHTFPQLSLVSNLNGEDNHTHGQIECDIMMTYFVYTVRRIDPVLSYNFRSVAAVWR